MRLVIDTKHPIFQCLPTQFHSNYQWWIMASGNPMILDSKIKPIVTVADSYSRLKHMGLLYEVRNDNGIFLISSMRLLENQQYPECKYLLHCILHYLAENS